LGWLVDTGHDSMSFCDECVEEDETIQDEEER
jgi:hypothetical protein